MAKHAKSMPKCYEVYYFGMKYVMNVFKTKKNEMFEIIS